MELYDVIANQPLVIDNVGSINVDRMEHYILLQYSNRLEFSDFCRKKIRLRRLRLIQCIL